MQAVPPLHLVDSKTPTPALSHAGSDDEDEVSKDPKARGKERERVMGRGNYTGNGPFKLLPDRIELLKPKVFAQPVS